jgi:hypothetical protein
LQLFSAKPLSILFWRSKPSTWHCTTSGGRGQPKCLGAPSPSTNKMGSSLLRWLRAVERCRCAGLRDAPFPPAG